MTRTKLVFLIEDDPDIRDALAQLLTLEGFTVTSAENGEEGIRQLSASHPRPDLILLDLMMPVMDGYEFLQERRKRPEIQKIPVVILTANQTSDSSRLIDVQGFLRKPLDVEKLISTMENALC